MISAIDDGHAEGHVRGWNRGQRGSDHRRGWYWLEHSRVRCAWEFTQYAGYVAFRGLGRNTYACREQGYAPGPIHFLQCPSYADARVSCAGSDGSIEAGQRRYNWVWYRALSENELARVLTSEAGERREYSMAAGSLSEASRRELVESAASQLPKVWALLVETEPNPFVQAIFDYEAPAMVKGRIALLGDAAFIVRPHTAMGVSKAAGDAITLRDCLAQAGSIPEALARYEKLRRVEGHEIAQYGRQLGASFGGE